ncbi:MAG: Peptide chain release factor 1 [Phycisphaerae bacterium]|nr:Peptide chain release factor 1 [Phycisphaerae bacterium]
MLLPDAALLAQCELHTYRASGPGGQKRNKTSSAVRLHHRTTGLTAVATESRSQHENRARALQRLREAIAVNIREPPPVRVTFPDAVMTAGGRLTVGRRSPHVYAVIALLLDLLADSGGALPPVALRAGVTASSLTRFLSDHPKAWAEANRIRAAAGRPRLSD